MATFFPSNIILFVSLLILTADPRFTNIQTDPRFRLPSKRDTHVKLDKRFAPILRDEAFWSTAKVDRYGRKLPKGKGKQDLEKFYRIEDERAEKSDEGETQEPIDDGVVKRELERLGGPYEEALDETAASEQSDSSSEDDDDSELNDIDDDDSEVFGLLEEGGESREGIPKGEVSSRLAIVNLDWDNIRATDLMAVFQSFVPTNGRILNIAIYPSEFGKERMEREELEGPPKEIFAQKRERVTAPLEVNESDLEGIDDEEQIKKSILKPDDGAEFSSGRLRRYQISRLRYYYAVLICSSPSVASAIYDAVDGTEYLTTANFFDLRFIPNETTFDDDIPRDECSRIPDGYRPNEFVTEALQHSKVKLTWDADDGARKEVQKRAFGGSRKDVDENDLRAYLGSDSEDQDDINDGEGAPITDATTKEGEKVILTASEQPSEKLSKKEAERQRMRALLGLSAEPLSRKVKMDKAAPVGDMQVTFTSGLSVLMDEGKNRSVFENEPEREETTVEKYVRKEKERKAKRKERMKQKSSAPGAAENLEGEDGRDEVIADKKPAHGKGEEEEEEEEDGGGGGGEEEEEDLGFNDAFFDTSTSAPTPKANATRKAERRRKRIEREAAESASALERATLSNLLLSPPSSDRPANDTDRAEGLSEIKHFDINALARADKLHPKLQKNKKHRKLSARDKEALEAKARDEFQMDVADERFQDLYHRAEFAVDPSHPRFRATEGMRRVLEEGRKKKGFVREGSDEALDVVDGGRGKGKGKRVMEGGVEVEELVKKVKRKVGAGV